MENVNLKIVGSRLKAQRKLLKITQQEMALALNITMFFISKIENGKTNSLTLSILKDICDYLKLDMSDVVRGTCPNGPEYLRDDIALKLNQLNASQLEIVNVILDAFVDQS